MEDGLDVKLLWVKAYSERQVLFLLNFVIKLLHV